MAGSRYVRAYPALLAVGTEGSRLVYMHINVTLAGSALMQAQAARRLVIATSAITDHQARFIKTLEHVLRNPKAREQLSQLLDNYSKDA